MVIVLVLGLLIVAVTIASTFALDSTQLEQFQRAAYSREANYLVARSAFELGLTLLRVDESDVDSAEDIWAAGPQEMTWEGRDLRLEVEDEERKFPINALVTAYDGDGAPPAPSDEQQALNAALIRFLDKQGVQGQSAGPALVDWIDSDNLPVVGGSEVSNDPTVPVKNAPLDSFSELLYIRGWTPPLGAPPKPLLGGLSSAFAVEEEPEIDDGSTAANAQTAVNGSQWSDWLSLHSQGKININTAPREILLCLDEQMTDALVEEIVRKRQEGALSGEDDLREIAAIDEDLLFRMGRLIRYNSQYFRVRIDVSAPPGPVHIQAVIQREDKDAKVVRWEVY